MTTTTETTVKCSYCRGGSVYANGRTVQCLICKGDGRIPAYPCDSCGSPILDGDDRRWGPGSRTMFHKGCP